MRKRAPSDPIIRARELRRNMTDAERGLWRILRECFRAWHFRSQVFIDPYFADFGSFRARLLIEIDGGQHSEELDAARTGFLEAQGFKVIRFWNNDVLQNPEGVHAALERVLGEHPTPTPPRQGEGLHA